MKAITANILKDGHVVYLASDEMWTDHLSEAALFESAESEAALERAKARVTEITSAYLIDAEAGAASGQKALRETIRSAGPTVRRDLGKQAETRP